MNQEERKQILQMLKEGKVSTEEALQLLDAVEVGDQPIKVKDPSLKNRFLKIKVKSDSETVNVNLPLSLVTAGLKIAEKFDSRIQSDALKDIDMDEIIDAVKNGAEGKIVEVESDSEIVEIYVD